MRNGTPNRRSRNRNNNNNRGRNGGGNRAQVFDSNGPEVRIRGTAHQICEKYTTLAKDSRSSGDLVMAESYLQHAEHYQRMIVTWNEQDAVRQNEQKKAQESNQEKTYNEKAEKQADNDDLSLPESILGDKVKTESQAGRTSQKTLEDA